MSRLTTLGYVDRGSSNLKSLYLSFAYLTKKSSLRFNFISGLETTYQTWDGVPEAKLFGTPAQLQQYYDANIGSTFFTAEDSINLFNSDKRKYNYFTYPAQTDNYQQDYYQLLFNHTLNSRWDLNTAAFLTRGWGYYIEYSPQQSYAAYGLPNPVYNGDTIATTDLIQQLWLNNWFYGGIASLQYHTGADLAHPLRRLVPLRRGTLWDRHLGQPRISQRLPVLLGQPCSGQYHMEHLPGCRTASSRITLNGFDDNLVRPQGFRFPES